MTNAAIFFHPDGYATDRERLMGRHSAGESFLRGFIRHADADRLHLWKAKNQRHAAFEALLEAIEPPGRPVRWIGMQDRVGLQDPGCVFIPSPTIGDEAWRRRRYGRSRYSLCGLTHTTATHRAIDALADLVISPLEPWDGLICTSAAVRQSVELQLEAVREDLRLRLGATRLPQPQLTTLPLGVNGEDFRHDPQARAAWRERLGIPEHAVAALYVGRLNVLAKMNPALMAQALERVAGRTDQPIHWIVSGWAPTEADWEGFHAATRAFCPSVTYHAVDGRKPDTRFSIWSAADLFISFSDNIQETFGLTPAEAMAAGLPCVVSDWNGYRDTVRHGLDGFRIPTCAPRPGLTEDLVFHHDYGWTAYENYVGAVAQMVSIDLEAASRAILDLVENPDLRRRMGAAGRRRIDEALDWKAVIPRYQAFWGELASRRAAAQAEPPAIAAHLKNPRRLDPLTLFASYPTQALHPADRIVVGSVADWTEAEARLSRNLAAAGQWAMALPAERKAIFDQVAAGGGVRVHQIVQAAPADRRPFVERSLTWMMKFDVLRLARHADVPPEPEAQNDGGGR
ncbi:MAG: glycosyltransferase family 4 protein [Phenylobacterium sp.]|uniref:glycosyltransferase family 4 protein n=1 Tax=Phenylobacterium sp. TaxID=1871053 RepID=UPI00180E8B6F|nr:glycosyltransferase family 4 protein [Phenylobacterium sp.]MBA4794351.1 glycosyltransferase family 4 protein [Phenylobacterium sp.]